MRKIYFLIVFIIAFLGNVNAQHDVKIDVLGLTYSNIGLSYEYSLNKKTGINLVLQDFTLPSLINPYPKRYYVKYGATIEYKKYFQNKDKHTIGFWGAPYFNYSRHNLNMALYIDFNPLFFLLLNDKAKEDINNSRLVWNNYSLGYSSGIKALVKDKFVLEVYIGLGYVIYQNSYYIYPDNKHVTNNEFVHNHLSMRFGINAGYRFSGN